MSRRNSFALVAVVSVRAVVGGLAGLAISLVVSTVVGTPIPFVIYAIVAVGFAVRLAFAVAEWRTTTYELLDTELIYRTGRLQSSSLHIPWHSVRGIYVESPWLLRLFGRSEVRLSHGAGQSSDVYFASLSAPAVAELRTAIEDASRGQSHAVEIVDDASAFSVKKVGLYSLVHARWYVIIPVVLAALGILAQFLRFDMIETSLFVWHWLLALPADTLAFAVIAMIGFSIAAGCAATSIEMANFRVRRTEGVLESRQGLISTRVNSINTRDITLVETQQPLVYRVVRNVTLLVSGGSGEGDRQFLLSPREASDEARRLMSQLFPELGEGVTLAKSKWIGALTVASLWILTSILAHLWINTTWSLIILLAVLFAILVWTVRSPSRLSISTEGIVEVRRGWIFRRAFVFRASSILHYESVIAPSGHLLPVNRVRLTVADRGTRDISIRSITASDVSATLDALERIGTIGRFRYSRPIRDDELSGT